MHPRAGQLLGRGNRGTLPVPVPGMAFSSERKGRAKKLQEEKNGGKKKITLGCEVTSLP